MLITGLHKIDINYIAEQITKHPRLLAGLLILTFIVVAKKVRDRQRTGQQKPDEIEYYTLTWVSKEDVEAWKGNANTSIPIE